MYTQKQTSLETRELHADISTAELGGSEPIVLKGGLVSVIGIKPGYGYDTDFTGTDAEYTITELGDAETAAIISLQITGAPDSAGDISVSVNGGDEVVFTLEGTETVDEVATMIRASEDFTGFTLSGATDTVIFTADAVGALTGVQSFADIGAQVLTATTSVQLQYTIDDIAHVNAGTAEWVNSGSAVASGAYAQTSFAYPVTAFRLDVKTAEYGSTCKVLVRE